MPLDVPNIHQSSAVVPISHRYIRHHRHPSLSYLEILLPNLPLSNARLSFLVTFILPTTTTRARTIILIPLSPISDTDIPDLVPNLHPFLTAGRNRTDLAQGPVRHTRNEETGEEVDVVDVLGTLRHRPSNGSDKPDNVDQDTADIGCVSAPVKAEAEVIWCRFAGGVEVPYLIVAAADDVVVADDDASDRREEDGVGG